MKAPDVIYVEFGEDVNLAFEKQPFEETPAHIRKDALLEWLENKIKLPDVSFINGLTYLAYKDVIDKLNSM
jgi:hypothetical protein